MEQAGTLRPLGLLEIVDRIFRLYRANLWLLCAIAAAGYVPFGIVYSIPDFGPLLAMGVMLVIFPLTMGAMVLAVSQRYLGKPITMGEAYWKALRRAPALYGTIFVLYTLAGLILVPLAIPVVAVALPAILNPGTDLNPLLLVLVMLVCAPIALALMLVMSSWWPFCIVAYMLEGKRYFGALSRATFLLRPWFWAQVLLVGIIMGLIGNILQTVLSLPVMIPMWIADPSSLMTGDGGPLFFVVVGLSSAVAGSVTLPLSMGVYVLQYYDARVRKEGYDLALLAQELAASVPAKQVEPWQPSEAEPAAAAPEGASTGEAPPPDA